MISVNIDVALLRISFCAVFSISTQHFLVIYNKTSYYTYVPVRLLITAAPVIQIVVVAYY